MLVLFFASEVRAIAGSSPPIRVHAVDQPRKGKCSIRKNGCLAKDKGSVTPYHTADESVRFYVCDKCLQAALAAGEWLKQEG